MRATTRAKGNRAGPWVATAALAMLALATSCQRSGDAAPQESASSTANEPARARGYAAPNADPAADYKDEAGVAGGEDSSKFYAFDDSGAMKPEEPEAPPPPAEPTDEEVYDEPPADMPRGPSASPRPAKVVANKPMPSGGQPILDNTAALGLVGDGDGGGGGDVGLVLGGTATIDTGGGRGDFAQGIEVAEAEEQRNRAFDGAKKKAEEKRRRVENDRRSKRDEAERAAKDQALEAALEEEKSEADANTADDDLDGLDALALGKKRLDVRRLPTEDAMTYVRPDKLLPRMFYFENTYLGGSAAYRERLIRLDAALREGERPYRLAYSTRQPFDPPATSGLEVTADLDAPYFDQPRRVFLQVGLRGSPRYGWRRPPLDVMLVIDGPVLNRAPDAVSDMVVAVLEKLGPADRLGVIVADGEPRVFTELARLDRARGRLAATLDQLPAAAPRGYHGDALGQAMGRAGKILADASADTAIVPGTQTVLVVTAGNDAGRVGSATRAAHALTLQGAVTSVFALDRSPERGGWWQVANAGHGNYHHLGDATTEQLVSWELESLARVVARLVRVNIRLGKTAGAIRVLGTRVLDEEEVAHVKAREEATDKNLSRSMGITSDRGDDDDGIQTVIPYFYGDDSHVVLVELWVDGPGPIADVTVKYKDMVNLGNATARTSVRLGSLPRPETPESEVIAKNVAGFELAEALQRASHRVRHGDPAGAARQLAVARQKAARTDRRDEKIVSGFEALVGDDSWRWDASRRAAVSESLELAGERRVGEPSAEPR